MYTKSTFEDDSQLLRTSQMGLRKVQDQVSRDALIDVAARLVLGLVGPEDLPGAADAALNVGLVSPALIALSDADMSESRALFDRVLNELSMSKPNQREAAMLLALDVASGIANETIAPYAGAKRIWDLTLRIHPERIHEFDPFVYAASEWEDRPDDRQFFENAILREARALVDGKAVQ